MNLLILIALTAVDAQPQTSRLAVIQKAPDWRLLDQNGAAVKAADFDGKVVLVSFIFTTCNGSCPATTHRMEKVQAELKARGLLKSGKVHLLSITLDPERDTPQKLRDYMELYDADAKSWTFLTGSKKAIDPVLGAFGMWAKPAANGQLDHPSRIFLIDSQRRVREIYNLSFLRPAWVVEDIELLLSEK
jgi:protein SCO1/2